MSQATTQQTHHFRYDGCENDKNKYLFTSILYTNTTQPTNK